jgi:uncharacterized membrane protein YcgQ (UPF0703/DUF1980 family)
VRWPDSLGLPLDSWVEVKGKFQTGQYQGESKPILVADKVQPASPPDQPYLYP